MLNFKRSPKKSLQVEVIASAQMVVVGERKRICNFVVIRILQVKVSWSICEPTQTLPDLGFIEMNVREEDVPA